MHVHGQALPPAAPIDLATVCFANGTSPDRLAARDALEELAAWAPDRQKLAVPVASHLVSACTEVFACFDSDHLAGVKAELCAGRCLAWMASFRMR